MTIPPDILAALTPDQRRRLLITCTVREFAAHTGGTGYLASPDTVGVNPEDVAVDPRPAGGHADYVAGRSDEADPHAPARGLLVAAGLVAAFIAGAAWPMGSWVAAGAW